MALFKMFSRVGGISSMEMGKLGSWKMGSTMTVSNQIEAPLYHGYSTSAVLPQSFRIKSVPSISFHKGMTTGGFIPQNSIINGQRAQTQCGCLNEPLSKGMPNISRFYSTQNLFRLNETNAGRVQPVLDIENIMENQSLYQDSVSKRKLSRRNVAIINTLYARALEMKKLKEKAQLQRDENTTKCQELIRSDKDKQVKKDEMKELKERGRILREELRESEAKFNEVNDELVDYILSLPNTLDSKTPEKEAQLLTETKVPEGVTPWGFPEYTAIESSVGPGLLAEFPIGRSAWLDVQLREKAQRHLLDGGFEETGNAEYVKRMILQGAGIDHTQFLRIREPNVKKGWEHATYLAGGASFPSFLALFAQSIIDTPEVLPLRYFVIGRSYERDLQKERPGCYQSHVVQAFVACRSNEEMEQEFEKLQGLMESFYSTAIGFPFQTQIVPAPRLKLYEKKKLAFVMNKTDASPSKMVGTLSTVGDHVSKRLLCCYFDEKKQTQFLHLISAQFFDITHFLRTSTPTKVTHSESSVIAAVQELRRESSTLEQPNNQ